MGDLIALINQDCYWVRTYARGARTNISKLKRRQAIQKLGHTLRFAFSQSEEYETLIATLLDALRPDDRAPF